MKCNSRHSRNWLLDTVWIGITYNKKPDTEKTKRFTAWQI